MVLDPRLEERIAEILRPMMQPLAGARRRRDPRLEPQAGRDPARRDRARPGRDRARARGAAGGVARARRWSCCRDRRASFSRCGRWHVETDAFRAAIAGAPDLPARDRPPVRDPGVRDREHPARAAEADGLALEQLEITTCLRRGEIEVATSYEPPAQPAYDALRRVHRHAPRRHAVLARRLDDRRAGRGAAARPHGRGRRVVHGRTDGRAADRPPRILGLLRRGRRRLLQRGQVAGSSASTRR